MTDEYDFGFSSCTEEEIVEFEFYKKARVELDQDLDYYKGMLKAQTEKTENIYKAILPLLDNLSKDSDKSPYIHWPDRAKKIEEFKQKLKEML